MYLFEKEDDYNNVEYKIHIKRLNKYSIHHHLAQIQYRVTEGYGIAYYLIGIRDNGEVVGLNNSSYKKSLTNIYKLVYALHYTVPIILSCLYKGKRFIIAKIKSNIDISELPYFII